MTQLTPLMTYGLTSANQNTGMAMPNTSMSESLASSRTTMPARTTPSSRQPASVKHQNTSHNGLSQCCMHVHQPTSQDCKPGELLALRKVKTLHNGKTSVSRFPLICTILVPVIVLYCIVHCINSSELHLQGVALRSQYSDPMPEAVTLH